MIDYNTEKEIWKDIKGYEGYYQVSNLGNVRSLDRVGRTGKNLKGRVLKQKTTKGYNMVGLYKDGKQKHKTVSRLVAKAFVNNPDKKPEVNHIDENKQNNKADNLEWVTAKENSNHGTRPKRIGEFVKSNPELYRKGWEGLLKIAEERKIKVAMLDKNTNEEIQRFDSIKEANLHLGKSETATGISDFFSGRCKTAFGFKWKKI